MKQRTVTPEAVCEILAALNLPTTPGPDVPNEPTKEQPAPEDWQIDPVAADAVETIQWLHSLQEVLGAKKGGGGKFWSRASWNRREIAAELAKDTPEKLAAFEKQLPKHARAETYIVDTLVANLNELFQRHFSHNIRKRAPFIRQFMLLLGWPEEVTSKERIRDALNRCKK